MFCFVFQYFNNALTFLLWQAEVKTKTRMPSSTSASLESKSTASSVSTDVGFSSIDRESEDIRPSAESSHKHRDATESENNDGNNEETASYKDSLNNNNDKYATNKNKQTRRVGQLETQTLNVKTLKEEDSASLGVSATNSNNKNSGTLDQNGTMNDIVTSSTTLTLAQPSQNIPNRNPPAVSTVKSGKSHTRAVSKRTFDVNEDEDGSVTYQASSEEPGQNRTVTVRTRRLRTPSDATEELRDTIVERKYRVQRPAGKTQQEREPTSSDKPSDGEKAERTGKAAASDPFSDVVIEERDVIRTKKRLTSRGSNYYSRSAVTTRLRRDRHGAAHTVEHDVVVESGAKSVSKGKSWGNRAETYVTTQGDDEDDGLDANSNDVNSTTSSTAEKGKERDFQKEAKADLAKPAPLNAQGSETEQTKAEGSLSASSPESPEDTTIQGSMLNVPGVKVGMDLSKVSSGYGSGVGSEEESVLSSAAVESAPVGSEESSKQIEGKYRDTLIQRAGTY